MTSFVHVDQPTSHPGVVRAELAAENIRQAAHEVFSPRGAATMLLAAIVAALMVVANQVIDTWTDGGLMLAWIIMWTLAFAALGLSARPARWLVAVVQLKLRQIAAASRQARQDDEMWQLALTDARVMADISRAMGTEAPRHVRGLF